nr:transposase [Paraburkholderia bannensis]
MSIISDLMGITLTQSAEKTPGTRTGRPNYPRELRERLAAAACEPGVSVAKLARENGINANMLFTWRRRYLADQQRAVHAQAMTDTSARKAVRCTWRWIHWGNCLRCM